MYRRNSRMEAKLRVAVIGHSFIRRLNEDLNSERDVQLCPGFNLEQFQIRCVGYGGWRVLDKQNFERVFHSILCSYKPNIVLILTGGNDLCDVTEHPLVIGISRKVVKRICD